MMSESEKLIRRLYSITSEVDKGLDYQITQLLKLGCERFGLSIGIVSSIEGDKYTVMHKVCPAEVELPVGAEFELGSTYCVETMMADGPVGFHYVKECEMNTHPAYIAFGLEAYIGIPIKINNKAIGTLNFSSSLPHSDPFNDIDIDALNLMASWLGAEIQRRDSEEKLRTANRQLVKLTNNLSDQAKELELAKQQSDIASKEKSKFLATMSHEIRTPMNGVLGMAELLKSTNLDVVQKDYVRTILNSGNLLLSIINDILDYSKLDAGKVELEQIPFNLEYVAHDVLEMMARSVNKNIQIIFDYPLDADKEFIGDPSRLRQILFNIVGNAIKFTEHGHVYLYVSVNDNEDGSKDVLIIIKDTGIGLTATQLNDLFKPFQQGDLTTTRKFGGTGLGLAICQHLVGLMQGSIEVSSVEHKGATFKIKIPFQQQQTDLKRTESSLDGVKILLVDDNEVNRKVLGNMLTSFGADVTIVDHANKVMNVLRKANSEQLPFEIAILDYNMPGNDGLSLGKEIMATSELNQPSLVILTSLAQPGDTAQFEKAGFSAYLTKPVRSDIFKSVLGFVNNDSDKARGIITKHSVMEAEQQDLSSLDLSGRVLLVEDNQVNQIVAATMLEEIGFDVEIANDGLQALEKFQPGKFDLVLMDCQMPNMDGYEATREIRKRESGAELPVLALTANVTEGDIRLCKEAGMDEIITKPFKPGDLASKISLYLNN